MKNLEPTLLEGFLLCIWDRETIRQQTSAWKRNLLVFLSGVCLELAVMPHLAAWMGYESPGLTWVLTAVLFPLGIVGLYASKYGSDHFVEWLLVLPELKRRT
jgi:hypothetical protein